MTDCGNERDGGEERDGEKGEGKYNEKIGVKEREGE